MASKFAPGSQLGGYRIEESIGAGAMGVVYRAIDSKLGRPVALKVIRPDFLHDEGLARFEREARLLASLNHPHIAAIHGMEESGDAKFLVLEYVPGPTVADRLRCGPLPIREAILMGKQIAEALEAAHAKGIIHRDLKPANIKIGPEGSVKVLDFGLAKWINLPQVVQSADSTVTASETITQSMTIVGTAAYMSPEQARGQEVDARTDIWAFGCVLYEAVTGKRAFAGATVTEILAGVLKADPDWAAVPAETRAPLQTLLKRCLRKPPDHRLCDIGDARIELEDLLSAPVQETAAGKPAAITRRTAISVLSGAAAGAAAKGVFFISRYRGALPRHLTRFAIAVPELQPAVAGRLA